MNEVVQTKPVRKTLSLAKEKRLPAEYGITPPHFVNNDDSVYMVWRAGGDMPKRVYKAGERNRAMADARTLAATYGCRFYVMRAWRGYDPE